MRERRKSIFTRILSAVLVAAMILAFAPGMNAQAASKKKGWVSKGGYKYYYLKSGKMATGLTKIGKKTYYFAPKKMTVTVGGKKKVVLKKGAAAKGWYKIKNDYYYFSRSSGLMSKSCVVDGITIKKNGKAKKTAYNKKKIELMILARETVQGITNIKDSKAVKRSKCFNWVKEFELKYGTNDGKGNPLILENIRGQKDWDIQFASFGLKNHMGDCVAHAATLAYLFLECGYKTVYIVDDKKGEGYNPKNPAHAWVMVSNRAYDAYFASLSGHGGDEKNYDTGYACNKTGNYGDWPINLKNVSTGEASLYPY